MRILKRFGLIAWGNAHFEENIFVLFMSFRLYLFGEFNNGFEMNIGLLVLEKRRKK